MYNTNIPTDRELPSTGKLIKSTIIAVITAGVLLITVVMPSEYGIDPTGIGQAIGLKKMGEIKTSLAEEAAADKAKDLATKVEPIKQEENVTETQSFAETRSDEIQVTLAPDEGTEIKVKMAKDANVSYEWWTDGDKANFDVHAASKKLKISYHRYYKGSDTRKSGEITAAFDGSHGWFWRNRSDKNMTITLKTTGEYSNIKEMK
ncbi:MAG: transmembrane anchor protein [Alphaproteobacteria bacterium]